jgi:hypothetical protein
VGQGGEAGLRCELVAATGPEKERPEESGLCWEVAWILAAAGVQVLLAQDRLDRGEGMGANWALNVHSPLCTHTFMHLRVWPHNLGVSRRRAAEQEGPRSRLGRGRKLAAVSEKVVGVSAAQRVASICLLALLSDGIVKCDRGGLSVIRAVAEQTPDLDHQSSSTARALVVKHHTLMLIVATSSARTAAHPSMQLDRLLQGHHRGEWGTFRTEGTSAPRAACR